MRLSSILIATSLNILSTYCQQSTRCSLPINNLFPALSHQGMILSDVSCPANPPLSTTQRTVFGTNGCIVYGYPSTGGILINDYPSLLDMLFLSLSRTQVSHRAPSTDDEDRFCRLLRRTGATWWHSEQDWIDTQIGMREMTEDEKKVLVLGWPTDGTVGVWVLRYESAEQVPRDFGRLSLAMDMEEKILMMREYGAEFVEDVALVDELSDG